MKLVHYSREGYNGDYTYTSVCGKQVRTHQEEETSSINPEKANCAECLATKEFKTDTTPVEGVKIRIYIESDILDATEFRGAQSSVYHHVKNQGLTVVERVFSTVLDHAWHTLDDTWKAVKAADEIYATSSLMPLCGNSYMGAPVIFNGMCERAIKENVIGKTVIILNKLEYINWDFIDVPMMKKAFKHNSLLMYNDDYNLVKVNITKSVKTKK